MILLRSKKNGFSLFLLFLLLSDSVFAKKKNEGQLKKMDVAKQEEKNQPDNDDQNEARDKDVPEE